MAATVEWGSIDGRSIVFPMEVARFNAATIGFSVPADAAAALLPGDAFEIVEIADGIAQLIVSLCDYRENPWGDYNEVNLGFLARPAGAPPEEVGSFVYRMPVDQPFTCEAGNKVMGFPKTVEQIDATYTADTVRFELCSNGESVLAVTVPRVASAGEPARITTVSYSYLDGEPYGTPLEIDLGLGVVDPNDVDVVLGTGPVADELRSLGLPKLPDFCSWGEDLSATFQLGRPV